MQASRARIVEAGDAERRRLERDLHDGAQQRLVTLTLALGMARSRVAGVDPETHVNLGVLLHEQEQPEAALACYQEALRCDPGNVEVV